MKYDYFIYESFKSGARPKSSGTIATNKKEALKIANSMWQKCLAKESRESFELVRTPQDCEFWYGVSHTDVIKDFVK